MQSLILRGLMPLAVLLFSFGLSAQLIVSDPAAPTDDQAVTIVFDATQGTGGLADCGCDVYLHTGVITDNSTGPSDWQYVQTQWGVADADWRLTPVEGEDNKYSYTFGPTIRDYFGVPAGEVIEQVAFVFRNADGTLEGKATGGADIFVDVSAGGGALSINVAGDPGTDDFALGKPLPVVVGTTTEATIELFDNDELIASVVGTELSTDVQLTTSGPHVIRAVATTADGQTASEEFTLNGVFTVDILSPTAQLVFAEEGDVIDFRATTYVESEISVNGAPTETASEIDFEFTVVAPGVSAINVVATYQGETASNFVTIVNGDAEVADPPAGYRPGATELPNGDVLLQLRAPGKENVFVLGNYNGFRPNVLGLMKKSTDEQTFWITIDSAAAGEDLIYQYLIDGDILQPDPYSTLVLDPNNDRFIGDETFAGIPDYPSELTSGILTWHPRNAPAYEWQTVEDYGQPDPKKMVVYELLMRDFLAAHNFETLIDTLDYLERLGVNAIELMPVSEFENNNSWGYNVSFHMALDKYYGSPNDLKALVDACHARGLAVILDVVYNHAFGQSPLARMWWNDAEFRPTPDNPYLNVEAKHPFNVGYDFNHESELTQEFVKVTTEYWLEEFRIDGFRFDLSKGFTQNFSADVGQWNRYDASRVAIIKDYADHIWGVNEDAYMILEHLAERTEEVELANYGQGMYFWSGFNPHDQYLEASMGYPSNLRDVIGENRGFTDRNLIAYMESHDEQRMQYKNEQFGNSSGDYDVRDVSTGLNRVELASAFFYTVPGPKMLWQFGELGYDFPINLCPNGSVNEGCRTDPKPIRWDYRDDLERADIYNTIADLNYLRNNFAFFHGDVVSSTLSGALKRLELSDDDGEAVILGNFGVEAGTYADPLPDGTWYNYFNEAVTTVSGDLPLTLQPGEYRVYLSEPIERMAGQLPTSLNEREITRLQLAVSPNPTVGELNVNLQLDRAAAVTVDLVDATGRVVRPLFRGPLGVGNQRLSLTAAGVAPGLYFLRVGDGVGTGVRPVVVR